MDSNTKRSLNKGNYSVIKFSELPLKERVSTGFYSIIIKVVEKISTIIGKSEMFDEGMIETILKEIKGKTGSELLKSLHLTYSIILELKFFHTKEDKYFFVKELISSTPGINKSNFEQVKGIFKGYEEEFDRAKFFLN